MKVLKSIMLNFLFLLLMSIILVQGKSSQIYRRSNCYFSSSNIKDPIANISLKKCYEVCYHDIGCTHYSWDNINSVCYLKGGFIQLSMSINVRGMYCGIIRRPTTTTKNYLTCKSEWTLYKGYCYKLFDNSLDFNGAMAYCPSEETNSYLAKITSSDQLQFLTNAFSNNNLTVYNNLWIGGTASENNKFYWYYDGTAIPLKSPLYAPGQPSGEGQLCLELWLVGSSYGLDDFWCGGHIPFICQMQAEYSTTSTTRPQIVQKNCPVGWTLFNETCYKLFNNMLNFQSAVAYCPSQQTHSYLAKITSLEQLKFFSNEYLINDLRFTNIWIGGIASKPKNFYWYYDGTAISSDSPLYAPDQPSGNDQLCLQLVLGRLSYGLDDYGCDYSSPFICQM